MLPNVTLRNIVLHYTHTTPRNPTTHCTGVAVIRLDGPGKMNTINDEMGAEARTLWETHIKDRSDIKAAVFISSKSDNFIAGACGVAVCCAVPCRQYGVV